MNLTYDSLIKNINERLSPLYLLYGEEQYLIETAVNKIKKKFGELLLGINYIVLDETNADNIISDIEVPAFGYEKKLIIVKNSGLFKKDGRKKAGTPLQEKVTEYIKNNLDIIKESVIIVFMENEVDKNSVFEQIEKNGIICNIEELKQLQLVKKLKQICMLYKVNCDETTLNYLVENCGTNLQNLINEIRKLIEYAGENGKITIEDVNSLAIKQMESVIFELTDNLAIRKIDKALDVLDNLIYQKEPLQKILITLYNHFKKIYLCSIAVDLNKDIVNSLSLRPNQTFLITKYKKQASYFKKEELKKFLKAFIDLDYNSKNGKIDIDVGLRSILCNYCG
ncbi:MAG TPA: DNA polymerase III subunit delta [Candidatus Scatovivens faecipullorum]|nr:DNA polymerase III subunit delta [Candidatus Scatovivens faecipullorum]